MSAKLNLKNMTAGQHSISGISSRRSACDKCRFSKAKCLRAHLDQARCDRCSRTDAECVTSPIFRLRSWQPPAASDDAADVPERNNRVNKRQRRSNQQLPTPSESSMVQDDLYPLSAGTRQSSVSSVTPDQSLVWHRNLSVPDLPDLLYGTGLDQPMGADVENIFDVCLSEDFFETVHPAASGTESTASLLSPYPPNTEISGGLTSQPSHLDEDCSPQTSDDHPLVINSEAAVRTEQTPMQRLAKLDYELITILIRIDQGPPKVSMETLIHAVKNSGSQSTVDDILSRTTDFIDLLKILADPRLTLSSVSPESASHGERPQDPRRNSCSTDFSDYDSIADSPTHENDSTIRSQSSAASPPAHHELDMPSLLLVLNVYIHLLRLHLIVLAHVYESLKKLSKSENPHLRPVPGLGISFPMQSGNLQTIILIQVITSHFERIDALLGLPREFRISRRRGEQQGLLSTPDFSELVTSILKKEDTGRPENGKGGIKALRRHVAMAKQLLRESIAP